MATAETRNGYSFGTAVFFIIGDIIGSGTLSVAGAIAKTGWSGFIILMYCAFCTAVAGISMAKSWLIIEERFPKYRYGLTRKPLATIGYHAFGKPMSTLLSCIMYCGKTGSAAVYVLLAGTILKSLFNSFLDLRLCYWNPLVAAAIVMPLWLNSPADFWLISYSAVASGVFNAILIIIDVSITIANQGLADDFHVESFEDYASSFGMLLFVFGGAGAYPNLQNDMKKKFKFPRAVTVSMMILLMFYLPTAGLSYAAFGAQTDGNILANLTSSFILTLIQISLLIHCCSVIFIHINPVFLDLEEVLKIPKTFNYKRCLVRTFVTLIALLLTEIVPSFSSIQALVGGTAFSLMTTLPPINYVKIVYDRSDKSWAKKSLPLYQMPIIAIVVLSGMLCGVLSTYANLKNFTVEDSVCFGKQSFVAVHH